MDISAFRAQFPVFDRMEYLNTGTAGPVPRRAIELATDRLTNEVLPRGRTGEAHWARLQELREELRLAYARLLGCTPDEVALTYSSGDGLGAVLLGFDFRPGDEILTSDEEHVGLLGPLGLVRDSRGVQLRVAPFDTLADAVGPRTRMIACSHVSWVTGKIVDVPALVSHGLPVLLDGAQSLGAIQVDVRALGCDYFAAPGQKWLCGPDGTGCLYVRQDRIESLPPTRANYFTLREPMLAPDLVFNDGARRFDLGVPQGALVLWCLEALRVLEAPGWAWVLERGPTLAQRLAQQLADAGVRVAPRGQSTLVTFEHADAGRRVVELFDEGFALRDIPGRPLVRASVGAWSSEAALDQLVDRIVQ